MNQRQIEIFAGGSDEFIAGDIGLHGRILMFTSERTRFKNFCECKGITESEALKKGLREKASESGEKGADGDAKT
jgi:hypothetical protein